MQDKVIGCVNQFLYVNGIVMGKNVQVYVVVDNEEDCCDYQYVDYC